MYAHGDGICTPYAARSIGILVSNSIIQVVKQTKNVH